MVFNMKKIIKLLILIVIIIGLYEFNIILHFYYDNEYFDIKNITSSIDKDKDGLDDQSDILKNAQNYIKKRPKYKSKYYSTGYPNDEYGVCTDVIAFSLLDAGYDLKELVYQDIKNNKDDYNIEVIDSNIDFRRVRNLLVYFENNAISLTKDINEIDEWHGGDIVIFPEHIGIISNKRNINGIPFLIHHGHPFQIWYEEDVLENYEILGHYRISE